MITYLTQRRLLFFSGALLCAAVSASNAFSEEATLSNIKIEEPSSHPTSSWDQMVTLQFGSFSPASVQITNGSYHFDYGSHVSSYMAEGGWALKLLDFHGSFYVEENLAFSQFSGNSVVQSGNNVLPTSQSYSLDLFGFDTRLMYAADWFPWKPLIPFVDGGYQYTIYYQPGSSGLDSTSGGVGNAVAGAGFRIWLNRQASIDGSHPIFLLAKANRIFTSSNSVNLDSKSIFGGMSFGL